MHDTMTILVHGTFSEHDPWTLPSEQDSLQNCLRRVVFPDDFMVSKDKDVFEWVAGHTNDHRRGGVDKLVKYCKRWRKKVGFSAVRLIGHSHGATVANGAVARLAKMGLEVTTLINLAVPVRFRDTTGLLLRCSRLNPCYPAAHKPDLRKVNRNRVFVFYAKDDGIVRILARARQNFRGTKINGKQVIRVTQRRFRGSLRHWYPTLPRCWHSEGWDKINF